jgi:hypothetical protein
MNDNLKQKLDYRYERIGEISYWVMLIFTIVLIAVATIGTAIVRKGLGTEINLVSSDILNFFEKVLWVFVLPVSIKIGGETFTKTILAWRGISNLETNENRNEETNALEMQRTHEEFYKKKSRN